MADDPATEAARKRVAEDKEIADRSRAEYAERTKGKPTPTQEECDLAVHGAHVVEKEDDGSGPDPHDPRNREAHQRHQTARPAGGGYQTRQTTPRPRSE
jgi:hypothetical protein